ncbi:MAG: hypothetical protein UT04_C0022G0011, partial [Candidatus Daviesbacteria bacterium GW2011_GWF2_38_7]
APQTFVQWLHLLFFYVPTMLSYIAVYSAIEEDSPSLLLVDMVHRSGERGCAREDFAKIISNELLVERRIGPMIRDGFVVDEGNGYRITSKGLRMAHFFGWVASVFGLGKGS